VPETEDESPGDGGDTTDTGSTSGDDDWDSVTDDYELGESEDKDSSSCSTPTSPSKSAPLALLAWIAIVSRRREQQARPIP